MENAVYINNLHAVLPNKPVSNKEMESVLGEIGGQRSRAKPVILRSNQIKNRYYAIDPSNGEYNYTNASLAADAVRGLFTDSGTELEQLDCLVASTSMADQIMPNHGVMVHGELKNPSLEVISTAGICLCGITALKYAYLNVKAGESKHSAVVASELASNVMHSRNFSGESDYKVDMLNQKPEIAFEKDFLRWMLSDGAGAALLSNQANTVGLSLKIDWIDIVSYADKLEACMYAGAEKIDGELKSWTRYDSQQREQQSILSVKQDVKLLNENIVKYTVEDALSKIVKKRNIKAKNYDFFLPHYSSGYFRERLFNGLTNIDFQIPYDKWFTNLAEKGNTGSASIFIMLDELFKSKQLTDGQKLLCYVPESGRFSSAFMQLTVVSN